MGLLLSITSLLSRVLWNTVLGTIGVAGTWTLVSLALQLYTLRYPEPPPPVSDLAKDGTAVVHALARSWQEHRAALAADRIPRPRPLLPIALPQDDPDRAAIQAAVNALLDHVQAEFVHSWFAGISADPAFPDVVDTRLADAAAELYRRASGVSLETLILDTLGPALTAHIVEFRRAEQAVRGADEDRVLTESLELHELVASKYNGGRLHRALDAKGSTHLTELAHLRGVADTLLGLLLPGAPELRSNVSRTLLREIVACSVLKPVMDSLSDPHFWNTQIDHWAGNAMRELNMVHQFRRVLEKQAEDVSRAPPTRSYEDLVKSIKSCKSLIEAKQIRNQLIMEVRRRRLDITDRLPTDTVHGVKVTDIIRLINKLLHAKSKVEKRIEALGGPPYVPRNRTVGLSTTHVSFTQLIASSVGLSYLMEFLDQTKRTRLLQFWLMAEHFRQHVGRDLPSPTATSAAAAGTASSLWDDYESMFRHFFAPNCPMFIQLPVHLSIQLTQLMDIVYAQRDAPTAAAADAPAPATEPVAADQQPHQSILGSISSKLSLKPPAAAAAAGGGARPGESPVADTAPPTPTPTTAAARPSPPWPGHLHQPILDAQSYVFQIMESHDFAAFVKSDLYLALINDAAFIAEVEAALALGRRASAAAIGETTADEPTAAAATPAASNGGGDGAVLDLRLLDEDALLPSDAVETVAAELRSILTTADDLLDPPPRSPRPLASSRAASSSSASTLNLADPDSGGGVLDLVSADPAPPAAPPSHVRGASQSSASSSTSVPAMPLPAATSGRSTIRQSLDRLSQQEAIVDSLLGSARRANKNAELIKILTKSKAMLRDEMRELLWQEIQDDRRDAPYSLLAGSGSGGGAKCAVSVSSFTLESDGTKDFALYVVEVKQVYGDTGQSAGPGWVVTRRFSEFLVLHQLLKAQFPAVLAGYELPKKAPNAFMGGTLLHALAASRMEKLSKYLQALCTHPDVADSPAFRQFICQEELDVAGLQLQQQQILLRKRGSFSGAGGGAAGLFAGLTGSAPQPQQQLGNKTSGMSLMRQWQKKIASGLEALTPGSTDSASSATAAAPVGAASASSSSSSGFLRFPGFGPDAPSGLGTAAARWLQELSTSSDALFPSPSSTSTSARTEETAAASVFSELFIEVFDLKEKNNWLRRQAILIVLQQLLGETIDRRLGTAVAYLSSPAMVAGYVSSLDALLWPGGKWNTEWPAPTAAERERVKVSAKQTLLTLVPELLGGVVGRQNATRAATRVTSLLQNQLLNRHLLYTTLDALVEALGVAGTASGAG
ncbi:tRNA (guanine-N(7)-)-methyltransferase (tRNA(m7G46)-methyltransferase) [Blastocladiella emersonii ATCC 22665]|nr:tRNA (guanine-N(7)-)-methyltransferase (tRNA(m7G46)-methyltransferase) [Blastocladiella emersonii ATCC 22665]